MRRASRVLVNAASHWVANGTKAVAALVLIPFLLEQLGKDGFGLTALLIALVAVGEILDLGLNHATSKLLADQVALGDRGRFNEIISTTFTAYLCLGLLAGLCCCALAEPIVHLLRVPPALEAQGIVLIRWYASAIIFLQFVQPAFSAILISHNRFDIVNGAITVGALLEAGGIITAIGLLGAGLHGWAAATLIARALMAIALAILARKAAPEARLRLGLVTLPALWRILKLSSQVFLLQLNRLVSLHSDPFVLSTFLGPAALAIYTPPTKLKGLARKIAGVLQNQLHPLAAGASATGNTKDLHAVLLRGTRYTFLMGIPVAVLLFFFAEPISRLWLAGALGDDYRLAATVLACWAAIDLFGYATGSQWSVVLGTQRLRFVLWFRTITGVMNLLASVVLVGYTSLGVLGALIPTIIIEAIRLPVLSVYTARICGVRPSDYLRRSYALPCLVLLALSVAAYAWRATMAVHSILGLLGGVLFVLVCWLLLAWFIGLSAADRRQFRAIFLKGANALKSAWKRRTGQK
jgi:O-antigen/teichoic acid export membrane protein